MASNFSPFLENFISLKIIPDNNITSDAWVVTDSPLFTSQWIDCSYPISGGYGRAQRYLYYALILFSILSRHKTWLITAALATVIAYSSAAAFHAMILAIVRTKLYPQSPDILEYYEVVLVSGKTQDGFWVEPTAQTWQEDGLWLPVVPMVWDADGDAVLAVVGLAFLVLVPMQTWSKTFKKYEGKTVLLLWSLLLLAGTIAALINEEYIQVSPLPQLRFCPLEQNDTLPLTNGGTPIGGTWDGTDWYHWNRTVTAAFDNTTISLPNICIYPCFDTTWPLRDPTEIIAVSNAQFDPISSQTFYWLMFALYCIVVSSGLSSLTIFVTKANKNARRLQHQSLIELFQRWKTAFQGPEVPQNVFKALWATWLKLFNYYALALSPIAVLLFLVFIEWTMWYDNQGESFRHVGQWGPITATALVLIAAVVDHFRPKAAEWVRGHRWFGWLRRHGWFVDEDDENGLLSDGMRLYIVEDVSVNADRIVDEHASSEHRNLIKSLHSNTW
jgi:hypothetical protein